MPRTAGGTPAKRAPCGALLGRTDVNTGCRLSVSTASSGVAPVPDENRLTVIDVERGSVAADLAQHYLSGAARPSQARLSAFVRTFSASMTAAEPS